MDMMYRNVNFSESVIKLCKDMGADIEPTQQSKNDADIYNLLNKYVSLGNKEGIAEKNQRLNKHLVGIHNVFSAHELMPKAELEKIGLINPQGKFIMHNRYVFPIYNQNNRICGLMGERKDEATMPKYLYSIKTDIFDKKDILFNLDKLDLKLSYIICVEGVYDAIKLSSYCWNAVATLGTAISSEQLIQLNKRTSTVILFFDNDRAGRQATWSFIEKYFATPNINFQIFISTKLVLPSELTAKDPDQMSLYQLRDVMEHVNTLELHIYQTFRAKFPDYKYYPEFIVETEKLFKKGDSKSLYHQTLLYYRWGLCAPVLKSRAKENLHKGLYLIYVENRNSKAEDRRKYTKLFEQTYGTIWREVKPLKSYKRKMHPESTWNMKEDPNKHKFHVALFLIKILHYFEHFKDRIPEYQWENINARLIDSFGSYIEES